MEKLNNKAITRHEFSTGVVLNSTETGGGIVSLSQNWMNVSFRDGQVPYSIERAISKRAAKRCVNQFFREITSQ